MQISQMMVDDPIARRLIEAKSHSSAVLYLVAVQLVVLAGLEYVAARALTHTYDALLVRSVLWAAPLLCILLNLYALARRANVYLYTNLAWRFVASAVSILVALTLLAPRA